MNASVRATPGRLVPAVGRERRRRPGLVTPYDFRRPVKLSRENSRSLQLTFETFARQASIVMTSALRSVCQIDLVEIEQRTYTEYVESLAETTYMTVFSMQPVQQPAVLEMPLPVVMGCVDRLLGGPGPADQPMRPLTDLESTVVAGLYERLVAEVRYALSTLVAIEPRIVGVEYSPQLAQLANASDAMVVARFVLRRGEVEHPLTLAMSFNGLLPFLNATGSAAVVTERERAQRAEASARLAAGFQEVPVEVAVRFRGTVADPVELSGLQVGDVVRLKHPAQAPLDVTAADVVFAHAMAGTQGTRLAARVVAAPLQENS
ncbi:MAG: flagellar motor switch protein FliM [Nocardioides sp.]